MKRKNFVTIWSEQKLSSRTLYKKKYKFNKGQHRWEVYKNIKIQKYEPGQSYFGWHCESTG